MNRFRHEYLQMKGSHAVTPEQEPETLPDLDLDAPATPDDLRKLQQVEAAFGQYLPPSQPAETAPPANETNETAAADNVPLPDSPLIMDTLTAFIRRFLVCSEDQLTVLALWVLHTWCYDAFHVTPCLNVYSAEKHTGKTTCLQLLRCLCPDAWYAAAPEPAAVIKKTLSDRYTILLDDRHLTFSSSGRGQVVSFLACGLVDNELYSHRQKSVVRSYNLFSPRAFAGRGPLPPALADRSIPICLRPAKASAVTRARFAGYGADYGQLILWLRGWADDNLHVLSLVDPLSTREELPQLNPHQQNHIEPLLMLADLIGEPWPERARSSLARIFRDAGNDTTNLSIKLLYDIREAFQVNRDPARLSTSFLVDYLCRLPNRLWAECSAGKPINGRSLALLLERFDIAPDKQRMGVQHPVRGYNRDQFLPLWREYFDDASATACPASEPGPGTATGTVQPEAP